jgi:peptidoglycan/LPS O-acetylase OafA/YrhL
MTGHDPRHAAPRRQQPAYRHDLDGLRAVAIGLVAVYHVFVGRVSGGVDVFLMLSGFFVVGGLLRGFRSGSPVRLVPYLAKLVRRLVPSLVVVLAGVLGAAYLWLPRSQWESLAHQALASVQYRLNWLLAATGQEYGAADATQSPLQHIWSMSVQGQLFVAVPVVLPLVWAVTRPLPPSVRYRTLVVVVVLACAASFVYAMRAVEIDQPHAYYDTFARAWEYLGGALLALGVPHLRLPRALAHLASVIGICLILAAGVLVDGAGTFPGPETLIPLAGAALIIVAGARGERRGVVNTVLAWKPLSRAGRYAYTYYLWHWPVLVFTIVVTDAPITATSGILVLAASAVLAAATHVLVEEPVRAARTQRVRGQGAGAARRALAVTLTVVCLAATVAAPMKWLAHVRDLEEQAARQVNVAQPSLDDFTGDVADLPEAIRTNPGALAVAFPDLLSYDPATALIPDPTIAANDVVRPDLEACFLPPGQADATWCEFGDPDATRVLAAVGGSHVRTWVDVLDALGKEHGFRVRVAVKWSCTFFTGTDGIDPAAFTDDCVDWNDAVMADLLKNPPDAVFSIATRIFSQDFESAPGAYVDAWARLNAAGIPVVGLRDNPYLPFTPNDCVVEDRLDDPACIQPRAGVYAATSPFDGLDRREIPLTQFIDLSGIYCPDGVCPLVQGGRVVYLDDSHLTASYAQTVGPLLGQEMGPLLGWW